jgi:hypothetical protein
MKLLILLSTFLSFHLAASTIGVVDVNRLETASTSVARLKQLAAAAQQKKLGKVAPLNAEYSEALEAALSEFRRQTPIVIAQLARAKKLDVVLDAAIAKQKKLTGIDLTNEALQIIDQKTKAIQWIAP